MLLNHPIKDLDDMPEMVKDSQKKEILMIIRRT
jgi:hypothetical protein